MLNERNQALKNAADERAKEVLRLRRSWLSYAEITKVTWYWKRLISSYLKRAWYKSERMVFGEKEKEEVLKLYNENKSIAEISKEIWRDPTIIRDYLISINLETNLKKRNLKVKEKLFKENYLKWDSIMDMVSKTWLCKNFLNKYMRDNWLISWLKYNWIKVCLCWFEWWIEDFKWKSCKLCYENNKIKNECLKVKDMNSDEYVKYKLDSLYKSATKRWLRFDISQEHLSKIMLEKSCVYTKLPITLEWKDNLSIDRFDNTKWYIDGNIIPCRCWINEKKWDMTLDELKEYMPIVYERWKKFLESIK